MKKISFQDFLAGSDSEPLQPAASGAPTNPVRSSGDVHVWVIAGETWAMISLAAQERKMTPEVLVSKAIAEFIQKTETKPADPSPVARVLPKVEKIR
jgi:hypothetical protein